MLRKRYIRNADHKIIASVTSGFSDQSSAVRNSQGQLAGRTSDRFGTTRSIHGIVSLNASDPGLLIGGEDE